MVTYVSASRSSGASDHPRLNHYLWCISPCVIRDVLADGLRTPAASRSGMRESSRSVPASRIGMRSASPQRALT